MIFTHLVKHNGVYYPAGTDVPMDNGGGETPAIVSKEVDTKVYEPKRSKKYSEKDLDGLKFFALKSMAVKEGLDVDKKTKAEDIKKFLLSLEV